jgi:tetratricopeptide (TPR) repeat protein
LLDHLEAAAAGNGRVVQIVGDAGIGKSRLTHEFAELARTRGWRVVIERGLAMDQVTSYRPLGRLVRNWMGIGEQQTQAGVRERLLSFVESLGTDERRAHVPALQSLLDVPVDDPEWRQLDPPQRRVRIVGALVALALRSAAVAPTLLLVEDLHSADEETLSALATLAARIGGAAVMLLVTNRPEMEEAWNAADVVRIAVRPLGEPEQRKILDSLLGCSPSLEAAKEFLCERAGGNPLYLEESVRDLIDAGVIARSNDNFSLARPIRNVRIPGSITGVIGQRIDRLNAEDKSTLQTAAVIGRHFSLPILAELQGEVRETVAGRLDLLEQRGFIAHGQNGEPSFTFKHALTQEVAYQGLLRTTRRKLHANVVGVIERFHGDRLAEYVDALAEHAFAGRLWKQAVSYRVSSCKSAIERSASREAVAAFDRALEMFEQMPEDGAKLKAAIDLRAVVLNALLPLGDHARMVRTLREAEQLAQSIGDERRLGVVQSNLAMGLWLSGENDQALELAERAAALADRLGNEALALGARFNIGIILHAQGRYEQAVAVHTRLLPHLVDRERERMNWGGYPGVFVRTYLAQSCLELGRFAAAGEYVAYASSLADRFNHPYSQAMIRAIAGQLLLAQERPQDAIALLDATVTLCREHEIFTMWPLIAARLAAGFVRVGHIQPAREALEPVLAPATYQRSGVYIWGELFLAAGETELADGAPDKAAGFAQQAEALCRKNGAIGQLAHALELLARVEEMQGRGEPPRRRAEALALARMLGMQPLVARLDPISREVAAHSSQT